MDFLLFLKRENGKANKKRVNDSEQEQKSPFEALIALQIFEFV
jgi:hypothetical protein